MRVTGFENDSRVLVKSQSRKRSRYRKLSTRNRVYRPGGNQINKSNKYDENGCKSLLRGTRMQNGTKEQTIAAGWARRGGMQQGISPSLGSVVGARERGFWPGLAC
jgi:hypothetical protein